MKIEINVPSNEAVQRVAGKVAVTGAIVMYVGIVAGIVATVAGNAKATK